VSLRDRVDPDPVAAMGVQNAHREIFRLLDELECAEERVHLVELLDALAELLSVHFSDEEGPNGLYAEVRAARPGNRFRIEELGQEHAVILKAVGELQARLQEPRGGRRIEHEKTALVRQLRKHERSENVLLMDTYLVDEGGSS
jgi:hemerythrin